MKFLYQLRVLLISFESLIIIGSLYLAVEQKEILQRAAASLSIDGEVLKYMMLLPIALLAWIAKELRDLVFENARVARLLVSWPDYWKLKAHVSAALVFAITFAVTSVTPWLFQAGISSGFNLLLFALSLLGQLSVAASVYSARFQIQEFVMQEL
ncbi:MAG: hypothetical protein JWN23_1841 [Rhodocyclales bacterium]|nr:hypothetical protein [Rhodocyclales bacterium]